MGEVAARTLAGDDAIGSIVATDINADRVRDLAAELGRKVSGQALDITDAGALRSALDGVDVVLNTVGPFVTFGPIVLEAAIATGTHYLDINDDYEPTAQMVALDEQASRAGVIAIVGMGASPGISNLLALVAAGELDTVQSLYTGWRAGTGMPKVVPGAPPLEANAAMNHWIQNLSGQIPAWSDGRPTTARPLQERVLTYPGVGQGTVWTCGHPEPVTLPRSIPVLGDCFNVMISRPGLIEALKTATEAVEKGDITIREAGAQVLMAPGRRGPAAGEPARFPNVFALAEGLADGANMRVGVSTNLIPEGSMGESTSVPLVIAAGMIARGEITRTGVSAPEQVVDPEVFFERLAPFAGDRRADAPLVIVREAYQPA